MKLRTLSLVGLVALPLVCLQGCALDAFDPKPDDPEFAPALPEEDYTFAEPTGGIYNPYNSSNGLYTDTKAHRVGDIIAVTLEESTSASKRAGTETSKKDTFSMGKTTIAGKNIRLGKFDTTGNWSNSSEFAGDAEASQSDRKSTRLNSSHT